MVNFVKKWSWGATFFCLFLLSAGITLPFLGDFITWFSWQWYFVLLWFFFTLFVFLSYGIWVVGVSFLWEKNPLFNALLSVGWFELVSLVWCYLCGGSEGVFLLHPFLLFVAFGWMRALVWVLSWWGACALLFYLFFLTVVLGEARRWRALVFLAMGTTFLWSGIEYCWTCAGMWSHQEVVVGRAPRISFGYTAHPDLLAAAQQLVSACGQQPPSAIDQLMVFPESALPGKLCADARVVALLETMSCGRMVVVGGQDARGNTAFCYGDGSLVGTHSKGHQVPFFESVPAWASFAKPFFERIFCASPFEGGVGVQEEKYWGYGGRVYTALLCSELFFTNALRGIPPGVFPLVLVNDGWFCCSLSGLLLWCMGALKALCYGRVLGYVSYQYAGSFDAGGRWQQW